MSDRNLLHADGDILVCAFRYALGRMTYMVDHVARFIEANADRLTLDTRGLIVREIDQAKADGRLGMDFDEARWLRVRARLLGGRSSQPSEGMEEAEGEHRVFMRRCYADVDRSQDYAAGTRSGLGDAAHLADAISRDILEASRGRGGKGKPTKEGERRAVTAKYIGDAIWAERDLIKVPPR